ncbi:MAG: serine/threonine protein kinase [Sandaracinus sp.]|nr:serine/threonine protein kinase [Sandaracinus sp.]
MGEASEDSRARLGTVVGGRYRLDAILGEGGFGAVYRAADAQGGPDVALKLLHARVWASREVRARFRREAEAAARIGHPGIVAVIGSGEDESGDAWIALELLQGRSLADVLTDEGPMPLSRVVSIVRAVCEALGAAHAQGIVHRDLKPDNVFLTPSGPKLLDFGVSKVFEGQDLGSLATRTGAALGTPYYMAPEQAQGKREVDRRADLYALGVVIFELLTGERPFEDDSYPMLVLKICTEPPPPVTAYRADLPASFEAVLGRLLAEAADARFSSCEELSAALAPFESHDTAPRLVARPNSKGRVARVLGASTEMASAPTALSIDPHTGEPLVPDLDDGAQQVEARVKGGGGAKIGLVLVALLAAGVGAWMLTRDPEPEPEPTPVVRLPEPQAPIVMPFRVPEGAQLAWRWLNPLPRAMPAWTDVAVGGNELVAFVGREGRAARLERGVIRHWATGVEADLYGVTWIGPAQALAVGEAGTLLVLLQSGPRALVTGTEAALRDVAAVSMTDAVAVGDDGVVIRLPGFEPRRLDTGRDEDLQGVYVHGETIFVVGTSGLVLRLDGEQTTVEREGGSTLRGIGGCGEELYAVGDGGTVLRRREGTWSEVRGAAARRLASGRVRGRTCGGVGPSRWRAGARRAIGACVSRAEASVRFVASARRPTDRRGSSATEDSSARCKATVCAS